MQRLLTAFTPSCRTDPCVCVCVCLHMCVRKWSLIKESIFSATLFVLILEMYNVLTAETIVGAFGSHLFVESFDFPHLLLQDVLDNEAK